MWWVAQRKMVLKTQRSVRPILALCVGPVVSPYGLRSLGAHAHTHAHAHAHAFQVMLNNKDEAASLKTQEMLASTSCLAFEVTDVTYLLDA